MKAIEQLSLGWRTDLIFPRFDAQVIARDDYLLVRTPHNPTFRWGNFLLFDHAPQEGEAASWLASFEAEIAKPQAQSRHIAFGVDAPAAFELPPSFIQAGLLSHTTTVLTMRRDQLCAPRKPLPAGLTVRALVLPDEIPQAVHYQVTTDDEGHEPIGFRLFRERQMQRYAAMHQAGLGHWFGVFANTAGSEQLVADCGLFRDHFGAEALGRFQHVSTHPAWRRRGLSSSLVRAACRHGFDVMGAQSLVILADPDDVAIGLYESLGFQRGLSTWHLERRPADDHV